jgi:serralysin
MANIFSVTLSGDQEVPVVPTTASGAGTVVWDERDSTARYSITVTGIDFGAAVGTGPQTPDTGDDLTSMHVHNGIRGATGPVVFGQFSPNHDDDDVSFTQNADGSWTVRGIWETTDPSSQPITNFAASLTAAIVGEDVPLYFNVHTTDFPSGEVRGQWVAAGERQTGTGASETIAAPAGEALVAEAQGGDDSVTGGAQSDVLAGGLGQDTLFGVGGDDSILGGAGDDMIAAGAGDDSIRGEAGSDVIAGGDGADSIVGGTGNDTMTGGLGPDVFVFARGEVTGADRIRDFGPGDIVMLVGFDPDLGGPENFSASGGNTILDLGGGDTVTFVGRLPASFSEADFVFA